MAQLNDRRNPNKSLGIDACQGGWVIFCLYSGGRYEFERRDTIDEIFPRHADAASILIDIPIGLAERATDHRPDGALRARLKGKASSVFETPCRQAVYAATPAEARAANKLILNKSLSAQSLGFSKKIREVDEFLLKNPSYVDRLRESHPEYAFALLSGGRPLLSRKVEPAGLEERLSVLQSHFPPARQALDAVRQRGFPESTLNDFLDAMVLAVMGYYGIARGFETIPANPPRDPKGLRMEIAFCRPEGSIT